MNTEDYNIFLDSLVIKEGKLICADNAVLWTYSDNEIIRSIGKLISRSGRNEDCSKNGTNFKNQNNKLRNLNITEKRNLFQSITFVNGKAVSGVLPKENRAEIYSFLRETDEEEDPKWNQLCRQKFINGWKCRPIDNNEAYCYEKSCNMGIIRP